MKYKVSELEGDLLDAAVAKAEGHLYRRYSVSFDNRFSKVCCMIARHSQTEISRRMADYGEMFQPSAPWDKGPEQFVTIMEREKIMVDPPRDDDDRQPAGWSAIVLTAPDNGSRVWEYGPTAQIAAMRAWVASKFGDEVDIDDVSVPERFPFWKRLEFGE